jgi:hypothetical protein
MVKELSSEVEQPKNDSVALKLQIQDIQGHLGGGYSRNLYKNQPSQDSLPSSSTQMSYKDIVIASRDFSAPPRVSA